MMKKIFDDIRKEIDIHSDEACFMPDDTMVVSENELKQLLEEAEAKWKADCCEWKQYEEKYGTRYQNCRATESPVDTFAFKFCPYCGKPIKISEVE